ncbi:MAG: hypothetical protein LBG11_00055 [Bifidobacteriaceae bacterium]|jgi:glutamine synthetase|nr:hypothetical protein [Bifidobacteriaceae bacterium]
MTAVAAPQIEHLTRSETLETPNGPPTGSTAPDQISLAQLARRDGIEFIMATFTTMTGRPCSKLVPVCAAADL